MKKYLSLLLILLIAFSTPALAEAISDNLLKNGDFANVSGELPDGWRKEMWLTDAGVSVLSVEDDGSGSNCVSIVNVDANDARFAQTVSVKPDTLYKLGAMVWAEGCDESGIGATLSVSGVFVYSDALYDTQGEWQPLELYGYTGEDQTDLTVFCRVGGYSTLTRGAARFKDVSLVEMSSAPEGTPVRYFYESNSPIVIEDEDVEFGEIANDKPERSTEAWLLFTFVYVLIALAIVRKRTSLFPGAQSGRTGIALAVMLALAVVVRLVVAARVPGYYTDINCFTAWSERIFKVGISNFYAPDQFCDYPPGYMLLLWPVALIKNVFRLSINTATYRVILKLLPILADVAGAWIIWRVAKKRVGENIAFMLAALYAVNIAGIANCAAWGQIDSVIALTVALCALSAIEFHYVRALLWFAVALLIKPQALLFAPLGLAALLFGIVSAETPEVRARRLAGFAKGVVACLAVLYVTAFVFCLGNACSVADALIRPVTWLIELYSGTMQGYRYITVNTLNLYCLLGLNWADMGAHAGVATLSWVLFGAAYVYTIALCFVSRRKPHRLLLLGGVLIMLITAFGPMIHERYVFPSMLLLALAFAFDRDRRILIGLTVLTATLFLNELLPLQGGMTALNYGHLQASETWLNNMGSIVVVFNALFAAWTAFDICVCGHIEPLHACAEDGEPAGKRTLFEASDYRLKLKRGEYIVMAAVTAAYAVLTFTNLGVTKAPQSGWTSSIGGESVVFDLGETRTFRMTYYGGICNSNFTVALSDDGEVWSDPVFAQYNQGEIFRWLWFVPQNQSGSDLSQSSIMSVPGAPEVVCASAGDEWPMQNARYVRITAVSAGLNLLEVGFLSDESGLWQVKDVIQQGQTLQSASDARALIDEQDTVAEIPSYLNSTYFDEIYHARTAYEHLHGMNTYEWTHPPLGKVWMMLGVKLFGMTPFGWRFMGALSGVLMLPLMYLLARQLTKNAKLSTIAMCLMALDSMHFTQTRIATIDCFAVFWIMLMYFFMFRYSQMNWNRDGFARTLVPLGLCGVTMGISWATKWIGIYASAGLAIIFFWTLYCRLRERPFIEKDDHTVRNTVITLAFCIVFFIVIPVLIYYFSYYWHLRGEGMTRFGEMFTGDRIRRVAEIQKNIFDYHSGLGSDTHYFRSPWYQWPVIWWPMWYYSGTGYLPDGMISSISCMGNPAVWWFGLVALIFTVVKLCFDRRGSRKYLLVVIGFASQFLPWVIVPRSTFIYHYFASVPFIILASVLMLDALRRKSDTGFKVASIALVSVALVLFAMFYPLESGLPCARSYAKLLRWFNWYNF